ncbi:MAG: 50S ribosomal protein L31 [Actinobacteria bacterium]|nr:50S ribosomal protein L31 [Cyanobacteriota bacterium]MCL5771128.1 50S ribosomal protein L31 [Actinomycetota bacterium]
MKEEGHPKYYDCVVTCSCGNTWTTKSTKKELKIDICSACHPFYTGKQKLIDSGGRVDRFKKMMKKVNTSSNTKK